MEIQINQSKPLVMHIDLNSCFAMLEQQANPLIRNKPVAVSAYGTSGGIILAASYEAKALGIKLGVNVRQARVLSKDVIILTPDPDKYFDAHGKFREVLLKYTNDVVPKSVDEFVVNFAGSQSLRQGKTLQQIGYQIKQDIKESLGEYVTVNVGIGPNRFLAKVAAGLHKPDGLDIITGKNLRKVYETIKLTDLPGINLRYQARLNMVGIYTPLQFLDAPIDLLRKRVFKGITGVYWAMRLHGHEIDSVNFSRKSYGQQYALGDKTADKQKIAKLLMKLCEKAGRRMRAAGYQAGGVHLSLSFESHTHWNKGEKSEAELYSTQDIFYAAHKLLSEVYIPARVTNMAVTVYNLKRIDPEQLGLFDNSRLDTHSLAQAADIINDRYGEFTLVPAMMANMQDTILKRVAFGNVRDL